MSMIIPLKSAKECFETLRNIYENKAQSQKRDLKKKVHNLNMEKDDDSWFLFTNISQLRDQIMRIGVIGNDDNVIQIALNGIPSSWETFLATINGQ